MTQGGNSMKHSVRVPVDDEWLDGDVNVPPGSHGIILFAHGSGSSRHSPRNRYVAQVLAEHGFATLLIDLLTPGEETVDDRTAALRFDIDLLAGRLTAIIDWIKRQPSIAALPIGLFGASTGGGAALVAAARRPQDVRAVVSRGGRPDLAGSALPEVTAPTLLLVGGRDPVVIDLNRQALRMMRADAALDIVPGATHLFEEPGALERVAAAAAAWFDSRLRAAAVAPAARE